MLHHMLVTSVLRRRKFCARLQISTSFALCLVQPAKAKNILGLTERMWYCITSASVTHMPLFSENIVVPRHTCICKTHLKPKLGHYDPSLEQNGTEKKKTQTCQ